MNAPNDPNEPLLELVVIYDHPRDYPEHVVVRPQGVFADGTVRPAQTAFGFRSLDEARARTPRVAPT